MPVNTHGTLLPGEDLPLTMKRGHVIAWIDPAAPPAMASIEVSAHTVD